MSSINTITLSGNLTRDAELRRAPSGLSVLRFTLAQSFRSRNYDTGDYEETPQFIDCVIFGDRADGLAPILRKGMLVCLQGSLRASVWTDGDDRRRSSVSVIVRELQLPPKSLEPKQAGQKTDAGGANPPLADQKESAGRAAAPGWSAASPTPVA